MSRVKIKSMSEVFREAFSKKNDLNNGLAQLDKVNVSLFLEGQRAMLEATFSNLKKTLAKRGENHPDFEMLEILLKQKKPAPGKIESIVEKGSLSSFKIDTAQSKSFLAKILTLEEDEVSELPYDAFIVNTMSSFTDSKFVVLMSDIVIIYALDSREYLTSNNFERVLAKESLDNCWINIFIEDPADEVSLKEILEL